MSFPLPFLKPITRGSQTTAQHARKGSLPEPYVVCQPRALIFGTPDHSQALRASAPSQSKSPRKLKQRAQASVSPRPAVEEAATQTYPPAAPRRRETDTTAEYPSLREELRKVEERLDSFEVAIITQRDKGPKDALAVGFTQELEMYAQYLEEIAGRVKRSEELLGAMLFRASTGVRKALLSLQIACEQDYEGLIKLSSVDSKEKPRVTEESTVVGPPSTVEEAVPVPGVYPELNSTKEALLRLKAAKYSGVSSKLAELYKSLLKMTTTIPHASKTPEPDLSFEPKEFSYQISRTFTVLKDQVTKEMHRRNMKALTLDFAVQTEGDVVNSDKIRALEELNQEKEMEINRLRNEIMLARVQGESNRGELDRLQKRVPELEEKVAKGELEMVALKKKETMLLLNFNEMQRNQKTESNKLEDLFKTQMRMKALLVDSDGRARKAERTALRNEESFAQAKIMHEFNEEKMKMLNIAAEQGKEPDFDSIQSKMKKQLKNVNEEYRLKREELKRQQEEIAEKLTEQISMVDHQVEELAEALESPAAKQKKAKLLSRTQAKLPETATSPKPTLFGKDKGTEQRKGGVKKDSEESADEEDQPASRDEDEEEDGEEQQSPRHRESSYLGGAEEGSSYAESPRWNRTGREEWSGTNASSKSQLPRETALTRTRNDRREEDKSKPSVSGKLSDSSQSAGASPVRRRVVVAPTDSESSSTPSNRAFNTPATTKAQTEAIGSWDSTVPSGGESRKSGALKSNVTPTHGHAALSQSLDTGAVRTDAVRRSRKGSLAASPDMETSGQADDPLQQEDEDEEIEIISQLSPTEIPLYYKVKDLFENRVIWKKEVGVKVNSKATQTLKGSKGGKGVLTESLDTEGLSEITEEDDWGTWGEGSPLRSGPTGFSPSTRRKYRQALNKAMQGHDSRCGAFCKHLLRAMQLRRKVRGSLFPVKVLNLRYRLRPRAL